MRIDDYGKFLILRRDNLTEDEFFNALKCEPSFKDSLQNNLYCLLCKNGFSVDDMYFNYLKDFAKSNLSFEDFVSWYFNIKKDVALDFLKSKKENIKCYFVDNVLLNGYGENFILSDDYINDYPEIKDFQKNFKEAIKDL